MADGTRRALTKEEKANTKELRQLVETGAKLYQLTALNSESSGASTTFKVKFEGRDFFRTNWKTNENGFQNLIKANRVVVGAETLRYVRYFDDFLATRITNYWDDTGLADKRYVVQTSEKVIARCILMTTDPGDLVLDPTCGSGTTAFVAEQWGRRWIMVDTSRIAVNIAKTRLMTATFPYFQLYDQQNCDIRQGFNYRKVSHITLSSLLKNSPGEGTGPTWPMISEGIM